MIKKIILACAVCAIYSTASAVHDKELANVYSETLIIPPELRADKQEAVNDLVELVTSEVSRSQAENEFLSMFD